ncbi:uncharacterized protein LOC130536118 [Takifugu flavidus]|uniref:uncharacterized protein LOC130536118 n=1 Tax=Takifugu flavidus TaxID=433684 RepID=UPI0025440464|nr:uncharacterized protein LOC130536118 [Takifugu flavidus]XP_056907763.1 uncharacterized protein LOC130536118 [Takifugu flavidus]
MQRSEESWQQEIRHLKELLVGKDQQICRVEHEKRTLTEDHADTLALLSSTQAALKQEKQRFALLEEQWFNKLADQKLRHQIELRNQEEGFRREVCENITKQMVSDLPQCDVIGTETRRKPEKILEEKETSNRKEIQLLTERIVQLQQVLREKGKEETKDEVQSNEVLLWTKRDEIILILSSDLDILLFLLYCPEKHLFALKMV